MSLRVIFGGTTIIKPGARSRVISNARAPKLTGVGILGVVGEAEGGAPRELVEFTDPAAMRSYFKSGPLADAAAICFNPANDSRIIGSPEKVVAYKVNNSAASSKSLQGNVSTQATVVSLNAAPFNLEPAMTLIFSVDQGAPQTVTFDAAAATKAGAGATYAAPTGKTLLIKVNGGEVQTFLADAGCTSAAPTAALINAQIRGLRAVVNGVQVDLVSDTRGTGGSIQITGGTGNVEFGQAIGTATGTGDVADIDAVSVSEAVSLINADTTGCTAYPSGSFVAIKTDTVGAAGYIQVTGGTAQGAAYFNLPGTEYQGAAAPGNLITLTSKDYGLHANKITAEVATGVLTLEFVDGSDVTLETSPSTVGATRMSLQYTGVGTACILALTSTGLTTVVTGGPGGENLSILFSTYKTIEELVAVIDASAVYTATLVNKGDPLFPTNEMDRVLALDIKTSKNLTSALQDMIDWVNDESSLATAVRTQLEAAGALSDLSKAYFTGGTLGSSSDSDWQTALDKMGTTRINEIVTLADRDGSAGGINPTSDTFTIASVLANLDAYAAAQSGVAGQNEVQAYGAVYATKTNTFTQAQALNSEHTCLFFEGLKLTNAAGVLTDLPMWSSALCAAATRASAELGEPLTYKYVRAYGLTYHTSFDTAPDTFKSLIPSMLLAGLTVIEQVPGKGFRFVKGNTTYTKRDDDTYTEESLVTGWKNLMFGLRSQVEDFFIGLRGTPTTLAAVRSLVEGYFSRAKAAEVLTDSEDDNGDPLNAWRNVQLSLSGDTLTIEAEITMAQGINFALITTYIVPVRLSA